MRRRRVHFYSSARFKRAEKKLSDLTVREAQLATHMGAFRENNKNNNISFDIFTSIVLIILLPCRHRHRPPLHY